MVDANASTTLDWGAFDSGRGEGKGTLCLVAPQWRGDETNSGERAQHTAYRAGNLVVLNRKQN